tara:strand:+ start:4222 stop:4485 length:264 start_codon:yes stop_codon:yes gene_type:complete
MKTNNFNLGQDINAGNFIVNIGTFDTTDVAIISKSSGHFVKIKQSKISKKLKLIKKLFRFNINNSTDFVFQSLQVDQVNDLITILRH